MQTHRESAKRVLGKYLKHQQNIDIIERNIYEKSRDNLDLYLDTVYQVSDQIRQKIPLKSVLDSIKANKISWDSPVYDLERSVQKEEEDFITNPFSVEEGVVECKSCGSKKTYSYTKQIRRADEGTSVFYICITCNKKGRL